MGTHDFTSFCSSGSDVIDKVRTIHSVDITKNGDFITIDFEGNGFLYNMIRIMVGTLIDVGKGKVEPDDISKIIDSKDRKSASATASASGLCLIKVIY